MSQSIHLTAKVLLLVVTFLLPLHVNCKPGIEAIRSQYGLSGLVPENEAIVRRVTQGTVNQYGSGLPVEPIRGRNERIQEPMEDDDADYENYDDVMARSLIPSRAVVVAFKPKLAMSPVQVALKPKTAVSPQSFGKCVAEVLTRSIVKPSQRIPPGNGSNPSLSVIETCCEGYERYVHNKSLCVAICEKPCINAICARPNVCECFPDHVKSLSGDCTPTCPIGCLNGHCHWNGTCECNPGYVLEPYNKYCIPYCSRGCGELFNCTAPETCTCVKGYQMNSLTGKCEPICRQPCGNGNCVMPDVCSCFTGYRLVDGTCQANCTQGCEGGRCVANEICTCDPGWTLDAAGIKCEPYCKKGCPNGKCVEPDKCACDKGYKKLNNQCKPHCPSGCLHGTCTAPNTCTCRSGYHMSLLGGRCKKGKGFHVNLRPLFEHVFSSQVTAHPAPPPPRIYSSIDRAPQPVDTNYGYVQQNVAENHQNPLYNPPMMAYPSNNEAAFKQILKTTGNSRPVAPQNIPSGVGHSSMYERQPAYNPFFQSAPAMPPANHNLSYLEPQPAFNPYFQNPSNIPQQKEQLIATTRRAKVKTTGRPKSKEVTSKSFSLLDVFKSPKNSSKNISAWKMTTTRPSCDMSCLNGKCTGRNQCTCNAGYIMAIGSKHKCVAYCPAGCLQGTCSAPGFCTCKMGYKKRNGQCVKV